MTKKNIDNSKKNKLIDFPNFTKHRLTIAVCTGKGGIGKTSFMTMIAASVKDSYLIYTDVMSKFSGLIEKRRMSENEYNLRHLTVEQVIYTNEKNETVDEINKFFQEKVFNVVNPPEGEEGHDLTLFIDLFGFETEMQKYLLMNANLILIPAGLGELQKQSLIGTSENLAKLTRELNEGKATKRKIEGVVFLNRKPKGNVNVNDELKEFYETVQSLDNLHLLETEIHESNDIFKAANKGCSVTELPKIKYRRSAKEYKSLIDELGFELHNKNNNNKGV